MPDDPPFLTTCQRELKDRLTATQTQLQAGNTTGLTGEQISGDLLTATIWSWFAAADSHNRLSQNQAGMVENPGLSYGLFHALAQATYSWGVIRQVKFPGVNMDIGHVRTMGWSKTSTSADWVNYNRLRGQTMSALEHAVPERFFNDTSQCNLPGTTTPNPNLPACPQGISAVKAIALAASQGQRVYTITPQVYADNPAIIQNQLGAHSANTRERLFNYLEAGFEVSNHQSPITQSGWTGAGFTVIDQATGAGGYLIEGGANGGGIQTNAARVLTMLSFGNVAMAANAISISLLLAPGVLGAYVALVEVFTCHPDSIINFIAVALAVAVVIAALRIGGPVIAAVAALIASVAPTAASAAGTIGCPDASCKAERTECFGTSLNDGVGGGFGSNRCQLCYETCVQDGGKWPAISHTGDRCDYWNFRYFK